MTGEQLVKRFEQLTSTRQNYNDLWQKIAKYVIPRKAYITRERTPGEKYDFDVFDSTAIQANLVLAAGLHSYLTNPASLWFLLKTRDRNLMGDSAVSEWLETAQDKVYDTLNGSNFAQQVHETYLDLGCFGTSALYEEADDKDTVRFSSWPVADIFIAEDDNGRVDTVYRRFKYTARQAYRRWGDKAGKAVMKAIEKKKDFDKLDFVHCIMPRYERNVGSKESKDMPWASYYVELSKKEIISESGYSEFPYFVPRFNKHNDDVYGSSPAMVSLPDILQLNKMDETIVRAAQIVIDPPISVPHDGFMLPIKWSPRGVNFKVSSNQHDKIEPLITGANIPVGLEMEDGRRNIIKKNFFVDLFLLLADQPKMTATEVMQRVEEKMLILAPTLGRLMSELLDPIISRTLNILIRKEMLPVAPEAIQGVQYSIEYVSPLARAQRFEEMKSINAAMAIIGETANVMPQVLDKIDGDELVDEIADLYNLPTKLVIPTKEAEKIREARAQQEQMAMELEMAKTGASAAKDATQAGKNVSEETA